MASKSSVSTDPNAIAELLTRGVAEVIERTHLEERLKRGDKLRVKFGIDPTAPIMHLGHAVPLRLLRRFQDLGHTVILLIGDFTARIGDPTGRMESRPLLSDAAIRKNMKTYVRQASKILDITRAEIRYNNEWLGKMSVADIYRLTGTVTYGQVVAREDFKRRIREDIDLTMSEFMYPIFQGYDSVALRADVEVGGTDQKFNLLLGRRIQRRHDQEPQDIVTVPLLVGLDGVKKMSKSDGNFIALEEKPEEMYGNLMSIPDALVRSYFDLLTDRTSSEIDAVLSSHPRDAKMRLAHDIIRLLYGVKEADAAQTAFVSQFQKHEIPAEVRTIRKREFGDARKPLDLTIVDFLAHPTVRLVSSKGEARRVVAQRGVTVDGVVVTDPMFEVFSDMPDGGRVIQKGKRHFVRVVGT